MILFREGLVNFSDVYHATVNELCKFGINERSILPDHLLEPLIEECDELYVGS